MQRHDHDRRPRRPRPAGFGDDPPRVDEVGPPRFPGRRREAVEVEAGRHVGHGHAAHLEERRPRLGGVASHPGVAQPGALERVQRRVDPGGTLVERMVGRQRATVVARGADLAGDLGRRAEDRHHAVRLRPRRHHGRLQVTDGDIRRLDDRVDRLEHLAVVVTGAAGVRGGLTEDGRVREQVPGREHREPPRRTCIGGDLEGVGGGRPGRGVTRRRYDVAVDDAGCDHGGDEHHRRPLTHGGNGISR